MSIRDIIVYAVFFLLTKDKTYYIMICMIICIQFCTLREIYFGKHKKHTKDNTARRS